MSTTIPRVWKGNASLTPEALSRFYEMYKIALSDEDKAGDIEDVVYYEGWRESLEWVLDLLHGVKEHKVLPEVLKEMIE